jgi:hypothetical protein
MDLNQIVVVQLARVLVAVRANVIFLTVRWIDLNQFIAFQTNIAMAAP